MPVPGVLRSIAAQRARAGRVAGLAFLAGALLHLDQPGQVGALPLPLFTGLLYALFVTPAAILTGVFLPGVIGFSDRVQWARLAVAAATAGFPAFLHPLVDRPMLGASLVLACALGWQWAERRWPGRAYSGGMSPSARAA